MRRLVYPFRAVCPRRDRIAPRRRRLRRYRWRPSVRRASSGGYAERRTEKGGCERIALSIQDGRDLVVHGIANERTENGEGATVEGRIEAWESVDHVIKILASTQRSNFAPPRLEVADARDPARRILPARSADLCRSTGASDSSRRLVVALWDDRMKNGLSGSLDMLLDQTRLFPRSPRSRESSFESK